MSEEPDLKDVLNSLVVNTKRPSELLEIYYWAQEDGIPAVVRSVIALSPRSRTALVTLLRMARDNKSVRIHVEGGDELILDSQEFGKRAA